MLRGGKFWRDALVALRRSTRDKRARKWLLRLIGLSILLSAYAVYYAWTFSRDPDLIYVFLPVIAVALVIRWLARRDRQYRNQTSLSLNIDVPKQNTSTSIRDYLEERTIITAALLLRAGSEMHFQRTEVSANHEVLTRQKLNQWLRETGAWAKLEPVEAELMSAPNQSWPPQHFNGAVDWSEQLRLLRWVLRIDSEMLALAHFPPLDYSLARDIVGKMPPLGSARILSSWEVRAERDTASAYLARTFAEGRDRGLFESSNAAEWAAELRRESLGDSTDLLVGTKTIADLDDGRIRHLTAISAARQLYAAYLVELLNAPQPFPLADWSQREASTST